MKIKIVLVGLAALGVMGGVCQQPSAEPTTSYPLPDEFWALGTWNIDTDESRLHDGPSGTATIVWQFTRQNENQYEIYGTVTYNQGSMRCDQTSNPNQICPVDTCEFVSTQDGLIGGVAEANQEVLTVKPVWIENNWPSERVRVFCTSEGTEHDALGVFQTLNAAGAVGKTWTFDIQGASFLDDVPAGQAGQTKLMTKTFEAEYGLILGQGIFTLYRQQPI